MTKGTRGKNNISSKKADKSKQNSTTNSMDMSDSNNGYFFHMSHAPRIDEDSSVFQMLPALFFTAVIIIITRMAPYQRPMDQFFWSTADGKLNDFFSYYKMVAILICAVLALIFLLYRIFIQAFYIKRCYAYIPMIVYTVFVILSYVFSDYKLFALWGWNERFEGTLTLIAYMIMLFFVINTVNSEKNVKWLVSVLAVTSTLLGLLGLTQALGHDFFQTTIGKKLITPSWFWDQLDTLSFTFTHNEIYQTIYNINYVSFYLTLLLPLFGLLFIRSVMLGKEEPLYKKVLWGALFALLLYNLIGSESSGGLMGMAFVIIVALIVLNKKIIHWYKPVLFLIVIAVVVSAVSYQRWSGELLNAMDSVSGVQMEKRIERSEVYHKLDYFETSGNDIILGYQGDSLVFSTYPDDPAFISIYDSSKTPLSLSETGSKNTFQLNDERYDWITVKPAVDENKNHFLIITTDTHDWRFYISEDGVKYLTGTKKLITLNKVPAIGWESNQAFGTGRGYIWSRTLPMLKDTVILGHGADTYCIYYPQNDYVGKYNSGIFSSKLNTIVDKPHNLYLGYMIGTGWISVAALLILWGIYLVQSFNIYRKNPYRNYLSFAGAGIFLGICGFLVSALVNDSSVSVMPLFYGLLGTGIAINMILKKSRS